jgi:hypothetical protein
MRIPCAKNGAGKGHPALPKRRNRKKWRVVIPFWDQTLGTLVSCLDTTLRRIGGAPTYLLTDNPRTVTMDRVAGVPGPASGHRLRRTAPRLQGRNLRAVRPGVQGRRGEHRQDRQGRPGPDLGEPATRLRLVHRAGRRLRRVVRAGQRPDPSRDRRRPGDPARPGTSSPAYSPGAAACPRAWRGTSGGVGSDDPVRVGAVFDPGRSPGQQGLGPGRRRRARRHRPGRRGPGRDRAASALDAGDAADPR